MFIGRSSPCVRRADDTAPGPSRYSHAAQSSRPSWFPCHVNKHKRRHLPRIPHSSTVGLCGKDRRSELRTTRPCREEHGQLQSFLAVPTLKSAAGVAFAGKLPAQQSAARDGQELQESLCGTSCDFRHVIHRFPFSLALKPASPGIPNPDGRVLTVGRSHSIDSPLPPRCRPVDRRTICRPGRADDDLHIKIRARTLSPSETQKWSAERWAVES